MKIPSPLDSHVRQFCHSIVPKTKPIYVPVESLSNQPINECFAIVPEQVATHGGKQLIGWSIWEWEKVLIEAEFHAVWQRPDGKIVDITPKATVKILFLPDPSREYTGVSVDNIRKPLRNDSRISRFCDLLHERFLELNKGDLAYQYGEIELPPDVAAKIRDIDQEGMELERLLIETYGKR